MWGGKHSDLYMRSDVFVQNITMQWRGGYLLAGGALAYFGAPPPPAQHASYARMYEKIITKYVSTCTCVRMR